MRTQLMINGELKNVEIENGNIKILEIEQKATGWERLSRDERYFFVTGDDCDSSIETNDKNDANYYEFANYFSSVFIAENIFRAQTIWRKILRWRSENDIAMNLNEQDIDKYYIYYDTDRPPLKVESTNYENEPFVIYFSSYELAEKCMRTFYDDLLWLTTEFKWRMDG